MTPLAHRIVKGLAQPIARSQFVDNCELAKALADVHCFDLTAVEEMVSEVRKLLTGGKPAATVSDGIAVMCDRAFLPAPKTWLEYNVCGFRVGHLLLHEPDGRMRILVAQQDKLGRAGAYELGTFPLDNPNSDWSIAPGFTTHAVAADLGRIYSALAIINTPQLIGRKQHMPHRGLEKALARAKGRVGSFPLRAWTELTLSISAMMTEADGTVHEAHYTGEKCLHFCRAHLRVKNGRLEQVKAHWRGNPALGIKRTRYKLVA